MFQNSWGVHFSWWMNYDSHLLWLAYFSGVRVKLTEEETQTGKTLRVDEQDISNEMPFHQEKTKTDVWQHGHPPSGQTTTVSVWWSTQRRVPATLDSHTRLMDRTHAVGSTAGPVYATRKPQITIRFLKLSDYLLWLWKQSHVMCLSDNSSHVIVRNRFNTPWFFPPKTLMCLHARFKYVSGDYISEVHVNASDLMQYVLA